MSEETRAKIGFGSTLQRSDDASPAVWADIGQVVEMSGPSLSRDAVDGSHGLSPGAYREFVSGLRDGGEVSVTVNLQPGAGVSDRHKLLIDDFENDSSVPYRLKFPNTAQTVWEFQGFITGLDHSEPLDDKMTLAITFKITGRPVLDDLVP